MRNFASEEGTGRSAAPFRVLATVGRLLAPAADASAAPEGRADFVADPVLEEAHVTTPTEFDSIDQWQSPCLPCRDEKKLNKTASYKNGVARKTCQFASQSDADVACSGVYDDRID